MVTKQYSCEREKLAERVLELHKELTIPLRHLITIATAETLFPSLEDKRILDLACGHNFPVISWFDDNNDGPVLAGYFASMGAEVTGLDVLHWKRCSQFRDHKFERKWGDIRNITRYFKQGEFDLIVCVAYFGYRSSRNGARPNKNMELGILRQAKEITRPGGYGICLLIEGYWQLCAEDLTGMGYNIIKDLGPLAGQMDEQKAPKGYDNIVIVQNPKEF